MMDFISAMFPMPSTTNMTWLVLEWGAYIISAFLILWMVIDMLTTNSRYSEETLTSSREGEIEDRVG